MKKVKKSSQSQSHDFGFLGILKKVKVITLTCLDFMTCGTSLLKVWSKMDKFALFAKVRLFLTIFSE
jgi:hypothetical protein